MAAKQKAESNTTNGTEVAAPQTNRTVEEIQEMHLHQLAGLRVEEVPAHELFGFTEEMKGVGNLPVFVDPHPLVPKINPDYVFNKSLVRRILLSMKGGDSSILLTGDKGTGKSSLAVQLHAHLRKPMIAITGSNGVDDTHLLGCKTIKDGEVTEADGVLSYAYRTGLSCLIDEIFSLRPSVLVGVNDILQGDGVINLKHYGIDPTLDPRKLLNVDGGMTIVKHPTFRLFATDNTGGKQQRDPRFAGVAAQNAAVRSRFTCFHVPFMAPEDEMAALQGAAAAYAAARELVNLESMFIRQIVEYALRFRKAFALGEACDTLSFREIQRWAYKWMMYAGSDENGMDPKILDESFVDSIYTNLEETDRVLACSLFESTFGRPLELTEEHAFSVPEVADRFIAANMNLQKAA